MGTFLNGDTRYEHEGYAAQVLDDGTVTGTYSADTEPRMIGQVAAGCDCGWTGTTRYPSPTPFDEHAEELALNEWEHSHVRPAIARARAERTERLQRQLADVAGSLHTLAEVGRQRRERLDRAQRVLEETRELVEELRLQAAEEDERPGWVQ